MNRLYFIFFFIFCLVLAHSAKAQNSQALAIVGAMQAGVDPTTAVIVGSGVNVPIPRLPSMPTAQVHGGGYSYAADNPLTYVDSTGLWPEYPWGSPIYPEKKAWAQQNLPSILERLAPTLSPAEASQLANDIIEELGTTDISTAQTFANVSNPSQLSPSQKQSISDFLNRLPNQDQSASDKLRKGCGVQ
jgi:hypothetical protein